MGNNVQDIRPRRHYAIEPLGQNAWMVVSFTREEGMYPFDHIQEDVFTTLEAARAFLKEKRGVKQTAIGMVIDGEVVPLVSTR